MTARDGGGTANGRAAARASYIPIFTFHFALLPFSASLLFSFSASFMISTSTALIYLLGTLALIYPGYHLPYLVIIPSISAKIFTLVSSS